MQILMATAVTEVVDQAGEIELVNMLASNQDSSINPLNREPLVNTMDALGISDYRNRQTNRSPVYPSGDVNEEESDNMEICNNPLCNKKSPLHSDDLCNDNNNSCEQMKEEKQALQPKSLFTQTQNQQELHNYVRENFYTHTNEERINPQQAGENYNVEDQTSPNKNFVNFTSQDYSDSQNNIQYKSPEGGARRYAWGDNQQYYLQSEGYGSDSDMLKNSSRNKKSSLDNPSPYGSYERGMQFDNQFIKGHRRVKSGDAPAINFNINSTSHLPLNNRQTFRSHFMQHSQSQGNINVPPESKLPLLNQSISVDTPVVNRDVHEHLCLQSTTFVTLQAAIADAAKESERLEREVEAKFTELNAGLNVKQNPTHRECQLLEEEIKHLKKEIQDMYNECDTLGFQVPGDPPPSWNNRRTSDNMYRYPVSPNMSESVPPITVQPNPKRNHRQNSNYENVLDYTKRKSDPGCPPHTLSPPPIPPRLPMMIAMNPENERIPENEHWICAECTFKNLLVSDCEICDAPRPTTLR